MNLGLTTSVIQNRQDFHDLKEEWNNLLENSRSNTIFLRWEWLYNWWLVYENPRRSLCLILVKENRRLLGIAPLCTETRFGGVIKEIRFLGSNIVCSDYLDFILLENREEEVLLSILSFLRSKGAGWNKLYLTDVPEKSDTRSMIESYFGKRKVGVNPEYTVCPYINLNGEWSSIFNSHASKLRNTILRKTRKFSALPQSSFYEVKADELRDSYLEFVRLNRMRMRMMNRISPFDNPNFLEFHKLVLEEFYSKGMAKLCFLKTEEKILAGIYLLFYDGKYHFYQSGFDPDWAWLSPGTLLFHYCIKDAHEKGAKEFDFLRGDEDYKSYWTKEQRRSLAVSVYNGKMRSSLLRGMECNLSRSRGVVKKLLHPFQQIAQGRCC